jgi:hypothetical protein
VGWKGRSVFSEDKGGLGTCMRVDARKGQRSLSVARFFLLRPRLRNRW